MIVAFLILAGAFVAEIARSYRPEKPDAEREHLKVGMFGRES